MARRFEPQVVAIHEIATWLESKGVGNVVGMNKGGTCRVAGIEATMTHALHSSSIQDGETMIPAGEAAGYVLGFIATSLIFFRTALALSSLFSSSPFSFL